MYSAGLGWPLSVLGPYWWLSANTASSVAGSFLSLSLSFFLSFSFCFGVWIVELERIQAPLGLVLLPATLKVHQEEASAKTTTLPQSGSWERVTQVSFAHLPQ